MTVLDEPPSSGLPSWSVLVPRSASPVLPELAPGLSVGLLTTGLSLRLSGPWPAYAFARAAVIREAVDG